MGSKAHQSRVMMILFVLEMEWVLSTGQDKHFTWHCSESGQRLGGYRTNAGACGLQFDVETRHVFVGDHSGQVTILKLEQESCSLVTTFKGHTGGVTALCWDPVQRVLFSGSSDHSIIMWDIGGRKGTAIELQGHNDKVQSLSYAHHTRQLISCGADGGIVVWNMDVERQETPEWLDSDSCQKCDQPFFWNFKQMWDSKKIGLRQHHCRKCGKAVCGKCSSKRSSIPLMGFEFEVRVCDSCHESITDEERAPTATFHDSKHNIVHVHFDATRGWLLTSGTDKVIKNKHGPKMKRQEKEMLFTKSSGICCMNLKFSPKTRRTFQWHLLLVHLHRCSQSCCGGDGPCVPTGTWGNDSTCGLWCCIPVCAKSPREKALGDIKKLRKMRKSSECE
ncbi:WD repeat and FYVE domain-containing protein 2 isoform X2 [Apteryx rowi]|uniref:WD repeat and FYVE domain-containing protein 2 isoform X2 n=1 Tax=Apteryx rowi TaxID=308060 RepID=UPI000E1C5A99|nr:WD repeat and FYVE domain-containing protein 2 isoform X2 [Apteryx rowi]